MTLCPFYKKTGLPAADTFFYSLEVNPAAALDGTGWPAAAVVVPNAHTRANSVLDAKALASASTASAESAAAKRANTGHGKWKFSVCKDVFDASAWA